MTAGGGGAVLRGTDFLPPFEAGDAMRVTRFAPSPTGYLHLGHAYSALFAWEAARQSGGAFRLRIEDIDRQRCRPEFEQATYEDLRWLGLDWDGPARRQSDHMDTYADARMARGESFAWRRDVGKALSLTGPLSWLDHRAGTVQADPLSLGDIVIARKDVPTSYHLAVTVDDHLQGVTLVTRGEDLFHATHVHRLLQALLGLRVPTWYHHNLVADSLGQRMSKRNRAVTLRHLRESRRTPDAIWSLIGLPRHEVAGAA